MTGPVEDSYDVAVVGAGLGGLSTAACLAKAGKRVLVVESQDGVGGFAHVFRRGAYTFDPAIHFTVLGQQGEMLQLLLSVLGVDDKVEFLAPEHVFGIDLPDDRFTVPVGLEAAIEAMSARVPHAAGSIRAFLELAAAYTEQAQSQAPQVALKDLESLEALLPLLFAYRMSTLDDVLDELVPDPQARAICASAWPYLGTPPADLSFASYAGILMAMIPTGPVYARGSFQNLADALADAVVQHGGQVLVDTRVTKVLVAEGAAAGVQLADGRQVRADVVVSNIDALTTFEQLVGPEHLPERFLRRLRRMTPSTSAVVLYAATTADPAGAGLPPEMLISHHQDHATSWADVKAGRLGGLWVAFPTLLDPSLAPEGEHLVILSSLAEYDIGEPWSEAKPRFTELLLEEAERLLPGLREGLTHAEVATPLTFERYTGVQRGAIYGWDNTPSQSLPKRLSQQSPLPGLFLSGHWTNPGTGSFRAIYSGVGTAGMILGFPSLFDFVGSLVESAPSL